MRTEKVVVSNPERNIVISPRFIIVTAGYPISGFEGAVQAFYELLERTEFLGYFIIVSQSDDLCDVEVEILTEFL